MVARDSSMDFRGLSWGPDQSIGIYVMPARCKALCYSLRACQVGINKVNAVPFGLWISNIYIGKGF